jgi:hypothetical protein
LQRVFIVLIAYYSVPLFSPDGGQSVQGAMLIWPRDVCELTLVEVGWHYGKNGPSIHGAVLKSMHHEHGWLFLHGFCLEPDTHRNQGSAVAFHFTPYLYFFCKMLAQQNLNKCYIPS